MLKKIALVSLCAIALGGCKTTQADLNNNPGSHAWHWFEDRLLHRHVLVLFNHTDRDRRNWWVAGVSHRSPEGKLVGCFADHESGGYKPFVRFYSRFMGRDGGGMARWYDGGDSSMFTSVFWNPQTGRFHTEYWNGNRWAVHDEGWLQESWPRSMVDKCPDLELPDDLSINEAQTSRRMWHMMLQDPDAVIRNETMGWDWPQGNRGKGERWMIRPYSWWNTYERRELEPPPLGPPEQETAQADDPDVAAQLEAARDFIAFAKQNTGRIFKDELGRRYVLSINVEGDEVWALDEDDDVIDVGLLRFAEGHRYVDLQWENLPDARNYRHRVGDPLPVTLEDGYHPVFDIARWIVEQDRDIGLPYFGQNNVGFRLQPGGTLIARHMLGDIPGRWRLSRGRVVIEVEGVDNLAGYKWRRLAQHLGWEPDNA